MVVPGAIAVLAGAQGYHVLTVSGYEAAAGRFEISLEKVRLEHLAIGQSADADGTTVFEIDVEPQQSVEFRADAPNGGSGLEISVSDESGSPIVPQQASDGTGPTSVFLDGALATRYRVMVIGDDEFTASATAVPAQPLRVGESARATGAGVFDVAVGSESTLAVVVAPDDEFDAAVQVTGPLDYAASVDAVGVGATETLLLPEAAAGTYHVVVTNPQSTPGGFTVAVSDATPTDLAVGDEIEGNLDTPGAVGHYRLPLSGTRPAHVVLTPDEGWDGVLNVTDSEGVTVDGSLPHSAVISNPEDTTYDVLVTRGSSAGGRFALSVTELDAVDLREGSSTEASLTAPTDVAVYRVDVPDGAARRVVAVPSAGLDVSMELYRESEHVDHVDSAPAGRVENLSTPENGAGTYDIVITGDGTSTGRVEVSYPTLDVVGLGLGEAASGSVADPVHVYSVQASGGHALRVVATPKRTLCTTSAGEVALLTGSPRMISRCSANFTRLAARSPPISTTCRAE
jgi:hypothetical protein